jgi:hypothetical protein
MSAAADRNGGVGAFWSDVRSSSGPSEPARVTIDGETVVRSKQIASPYEVTFNMKNSSSITGTVYAIYEETTDPFKRTRGGDSCIELVTDSGTKHTIIKVSDIASVVKSRLVGGKRRKTRRSRRHRRRQSRRHR